MFLHVESTDLESQLPPLILIFFGGRGETGSHYVALSGLKLILQSMLASNSQQRSTYLYPPTEFLFVCGGVIIKIILYSFLFWRTGHVR